MDVHIVYDDLVDLLLEHTWYKVKDIVHGKSAVFFTITIDNQEFDIAIKDASLREPK